MKIIRVSKTKPCPVCGKTDYCGIAEDRSFAICMRIKSNKQTRNGGYFHKLDYNAPLYPSISSKADLPTNFVCSFPYGQIDKPAKTITEKHEAYSALLQTLELAYKHRLNLRLRGLSDEEMDENCYRSVPEHKESDRNFEGIPGFYFQSGWRMAFRGQGIIIPVRDEWGRIQALQIRHDAELPRYVWFSSPSKPKGTSSGAPVHFSKIDLIQTEAIITEGALKADVISFRLHCPVIAIAGVSTFQEGFAKSLQERIRGLEKLTICFDSDFRTKPQVKSALIKLMREITRSGLKCQIKTWNEVYKGYDDYLTRTA